MEEIQSYINITNRGESLERVEDAGRRVEIEIDNVRSMISDLCWSYPEWRDFEYEIDELFPFEPIEYPPAVPHIVEI